MIDLASPSVVEWLQLIALITSLQVMATLLRNTRNAGRLVPVRSVNPRIVSEHNTIPLRFAGSDGRIAQSLLRLYGRVWLSRKAIKQPFLCDEVLFCSANGDRYALDHPLEAGDLLQATLAVGESESHAFVSAKRSATGGELQLVVAFPNEEQIAYGTRVRSLYVSSMRPLDDGEGVPLNRELEWRIVEPSALDARLDQWIPWSEVPPSALWLFARCPYDELVCQMPRVDEGDFQRNRLSYAFGSSKLKGLSSLLLTGLVRGLSILILLGTLLDPYAARPLRLVSLAVLLVWTLRTYRSTFFSRFKIRAPHIREPLGIMGALGLSFENTPVAWHGSARRSLAIGDMIRKAELWRQLHYEYWEPIRRRVVGLVTKTRRISRYLISDLR